MGQSVLIIGEDPGEIDFDAPGGPPEGVTPQTIMDGLNGSVDRLRARGHDAALLLTRNADTVEAEVREALAGKAYDVIVVGAGLRTLPPMAAQFEVLINALREQAPGSKLAFNTQPGDSDEAALRWL